MTPDKPILFRVDQDPVTEIQRSVYIVGPWPTVTHFAVDTLLLLAQPQDWPVIEYQDHGQLLRIFVDNGYAAYHLSLDWDALGRRDSFIYIGHLRESWEIPPPPPPSIYRSATK